MNDWLNHPAAREIVGVLAFLERYMVEAEERGNPFIINLLEKQHSRLKVTFDRHVVSNGVVIVHCMYLTDFALVRPNNSRALNERNSRARSGRALHIS